MQMFTILFVITGGLRAMIGMLYDSYKAWPISSMSMKMGSAGLVEIVLRLTNEMLALSLKIAAPFVIMMLVLEIGLGLLSRFAPQINVFFLSMPIKALILATMMLLYGMSMSDSVRLLPIADFNGMLNMLRAVWHE